MVLVSFSHRDGTLRRYECGGSGPRLTHKYDHPTKPATFTYPVILEFLSDPPVACVIAPPIASGAV